MAESSTATSRLRLLYRAPNFWGIVAMLSDLTLSFFHPKVMPLGPGWILGFVGGIYALALRDPQTGQHRRKQEQLNIWLILIPFALLVWFRLNNALHRGEDSETALTLAQCGIASVCCILTIGRFHALPVIYEEI